MIYLFNAAGFEYNNSLKFEAVHCQPNEGYSLAENGFYQTYLTTDIGYNRITIFPQGINKNSLKLWCIIINNRCMFRLWYSNALPWYWWSF